MPNSTLSSPSSSSRRLPKLTPSPATQPPASRAAAKPRVATAPVATTHTATSRTGEAKNKAPAPNVAKVSPKIGAAKSAKSAKATSAPVAKAKVAPEKAAVQKPQIEKVKAQATLFETIKVEPAKPAKITGEVKARRVRAPKNLAAQYGESETKRKIEAPTPSEVKRARRTAKEREQRRAAMAVDSGLLQRLAQANSGATLVIGEDDAKPKRRSPIWEVSCGKCGRVGKFRTPGALCDGCHTILVRFD